MDIFGPKTWVNRFGKNVNFSTFLTFCFYSENVVCVVVEYTKNYFPGLYCLKRNNKKIAILRPKPWVNPFFKNVNFSPFWNSSFYSLERRFFVQEYRKRHFPGLYYLKKKVGKMAIFRPKPWVNPFGKMAIFRLFELLVFIA